MSRPENYFVPVKNLLAVEEQEHIIKTWKEKNLQEYFLDYTSSIEKIIEKTGISLKEEDYQRLLNGYGFEFPNNQSAKDKIKELDITTKTSPFAFFVQINSPETFDAIGLDFINDVKLRYGADEVVFIYGRDVSSPYHIHKDPTYYRSCNVNIPLFPDYSQYRSTYFYETMDPSSLQVEVKYADLRTPVLLNNRKFHNCGGSPNYQGSSLAMQMGYKAKFLDVRQYLSNRGLIATPG